MEWCKYNFFYYSNIAKSYLLYSSLSNAFLQLKEEGANIVEKIKQSFDSIDIPQEFLQVLKEKQFIVDSNDSVTNMIILQTMSRRFNMQTLSLTLAPTQTCNFDCPYCYESYKTGKKMSESVQKKIIEYVKNSKQLKNLGVTWYGGEPTLAVNIIRNMSKELIGCVENYSAYMVTNGYLLDEIVEDLEDLKITGIQITLDGTAKTHNTTRYLRNGNPTFDRILENLDTLSKKTTKVNVSIRMNISRDNASEYIALNKLLRSRYRNKPIHLYPAFVVDYSGCTSACFEDCLSKAKFLKKLYHEHGLLTSPLYPRRTNKGCMAQTMNSFVIGPDGSLYKCWNDLGNKEKSVGNILNDEVITNHQLLADMMISNDVLFDTKCKNCVLFPSCYGGCHAHKNMNVDYCIPAKSQLSDYLDIKYLEWKKNQEYNQTL